MFRLAVGAIIVLPGLWALGLDPFGAMLRNGGSVVSAPAVDPACGRVGPALHGNALLLWLAAALSLPIVTMSFLRSVVRHRSNGLTCCVALAYVAVDLLAASAALPLDGGWAATLMWSLAAALSVTYTLTTVNLALHLES